MQKFPSLQAETSTLIQYKIEQLKQQISTHPFPRQVTSLLSASQEMAGPLQLKVIALTSHVTVTQMLTCEILQSYTHKIIIMSMLNQNFIQQSQ